MATEAKVKPAKRGAKGKPRAQKTSMDYVQQAIQDIDRARGRAGEELRETLDSALERLRDAVGDLRKRAEDQASEFERAFEDSTEDGRREFGRRAIMAQRSPEALKEMTAAIRKRKAELAEQATSGNGAS
jgi:uncharacterized protein YicC (UPF0701 family)